MKDLLNTYKSQAVTKSDYFEPRTNKRKEEKGDHDLDSTASECRYSVGTSFTY